MPEKKHKQYSCGDINHISNGIASEKRHIRNDSRVLPEGIPEYCSEYCHITEHIRNSENAILLDIQSQAKIWNLILPILDEKAINVGDFQIGGRAYSEIKKDMADLSARIQRNVQYIKKVIEFFSSTNTIT
jgi:hypothetical protein